MISIIDRVVLIVALALATLVPLILILRLVFKFTARLIRGRAKTGADGMVGQTGKTETELAPDGTVFVHGELWRARSGIRIGVGENIRVTGVNGLILEVEPVDVDRIMLNKQGSLFDR